MVVFRGKIGKGVGRYWPRTNSFLLLWVYTSVSNLVKVDEEMRPWECPQTDRHTHAQTQNDFIICPMLYAIAMGQIIKRKRNFVVTNTVIKIKLFWLSATCMSAQPRCTHCPLSSVQCRAMMSSVITRMVCGTRRLSTNRSTCIHHGGEAQLIAWYSNPGHAGAACGITPGTHCCLQCLLNGLSAHCWRRIRRSNQQYIDVAFWRHLPTTWRPGTWLFVASCCMGAASFVTFCVAR